jgi:hypothetical protein
MSTHVLAWDLPDKDGSIDRLRGFVASAMPTSVEFVPERAEAQPVPALASADRPDWWTDGTLPGVMAGKRPAL